MSSDGIHRKGDGWVFRWFEPQADGTRKRRTSPVYPVKLAAQIAYQQQKVALDAIKANWMRTRGPMLALDVLAARWAAAAKARAVPVSDGYCHEVQEAIKRLMKSPGWKNSIDITMPKLDAWVTKQKGKGVARPLAYLKVVLKYGRDCLNQPVRPEVLSFRRERGKTPKPPELLSESEVASIIALAATKGAEFGQAIEHLATYGCRPIDLCRLQVGDLDVAAGTLTLRDTKNGETVTHPLMSKHIAPMAALAKDRKATAPLFRNPRGLAWTLSKGGSANEIATWYRRLVWEILPASRRGIYLLKDYAISHMDAAGVDDATKALFTGHRDLRSYGRYKATNHTAARKALDRIAAKPRIAKQFPRGSPRGSEFQGPVSGADKLLPSESISYETA